MKLIQAKWLAGLYLLLLLTAALIPLRMGSTALNNNYTLHVRADYLIHALFYIPLPTFLMLSYLGKRGTWMWVVLIALLAVVLFETVQMLIPYRAFNINDLIANGVGVLIGLIPAAFVWRRFSRSA